MTSDPTTAAAAREAEKSRSIRLCSLKRGEKPLVCSARLYPDKAYFCRRHTTKFFSIDGRSDWSGTTPVCDRHIQSVRAVLEAQP